MNVIRNEYAFYSIRHYPNKLIMELRNPLL